MAVSNTYCYTVLMDERSLEFVFDEKKATQAAARIIAKNGGRFDFLALVKLVYLVDREAIKSWARAIVGGPYFSLPHGPVNSPILDLANEKIASDHWKRSIERKGNELVLSHDPGDDELSEAEKDLIDFVFDEHGHKSAAALRHLTHQLPEWQDPAGSSLPIPGETLLRVAGRKDDEIAEISSELAEKNRVHRLLSR